MAKKNQSTRLTKQHKKSHGVVGIFGEGAKLHDLNVGQISNLVIKQLLFTHKGKAKSWTTMKCLIL